MSPAATLDHATALRRLGIPDGMLDEAQIEQLDEAGWLVVEGVHDDRTTRAMRDAVDRLLDEQHRTGMIHTTDGTSEMIFGVTERDRAFAPLVTTKLVWAVATRHFGGRPFRGANENFRSPLPGAGLQGIHSDTPPVPEGEPWPALHVVHAAGDLTADNGATRVVPGSHRFRRVAAEVLEDPVRPHPDQIHLTAPSGSVVFFNPSMWHGGTANTSGRRRYALFGSVRLQPSGQWTPREVPPALAHLPEEALYLLGDNGWVDGMQNTNPMPCWCSGMRRTCHPKGRPDAGLLEQHEGRPHIYPMEVATSGFETSEIA